MLRLLVAHSKPCVMNLSVVGCDAWQYMSLFVGSVLAARVIHRHTFCQYSESGLWGSGKCQSEDVETVALNVSIMFVTCGTLLNNIANAAAAWHIAATTVWSSRALPAVHGNVSEPFLSTTLRKYPFMSSACSSSSCTCDRLLFSSVTNSCSSAVSPFRHCVLACRSVLRAAARSPHHGHAFFMAAARSDALCKVSQCSTAVIV